MWTNKQASYPPGTSSGTGVDTLEPAPVTVTEPAVEAAAVLPMSNCVLVTSAPLCTSTVPELPAMPLV